MVHVLASTIIGLGRSGIAGAKILQKQGYAVTISDRGQSESLLKLKEQISDLNITVKLGDSFQPSPDIQLVVVSPGVPWDLSALVKAREMGIETIGELAWRELKDIPWVGITGTNGKTTVTSIAAAIFQAAGLDAPACGNIGLAACENETPAIRGFVPTRKNGISEIFMMGLNHDSGVSNLNSTTL